MMPVYGLLCILFIIASIVGFVVYGAYMFDDFHFGYMDYDDLGSNMRNIIDMVRQFPIALLIIVFFTSPMFILVFLLALIVYGLNLTPFQK